MILLLELLLLDFTSPVLLSEGRLAGVVSRRGALAGDASSEDDQSGNRFLASFFVPLRTTPLRKGNVEIC